jgi:glycosyltransferase involved in cell wall biosynthesis
MIAHCRILLDALGDLAREVVIVTDRQIPPEALGGLGVGIVALDGETRWPVPLRNAEEAWRLARIIEAERPDVVHIIGLEQAARACVALHLARAESTVVHLPDLAELERHSETFAWARQGFLSRLLAARLRRPASFLLVACEEHLAELRGQGIDPGARFAVLGGTGVDPDVYPLLPPSQSEIPVVAFVGQLDEPHGVRELLTAFERLWARGLRLQLEVHGERVATGAADALSAEWARWSLHPGVRCSGWPDDTREVWRRAEICVWPAHARQSLPRALLEAAACGRALIVTDAAGGPVFVRDEIEGLVIPARDVSALGAALERLARDANLRQRMGTAARLRVLQGFSEAHVKEVLRGAYQSLLGPPGPL